MQSRSTLIVGTLALQSLAFAQSIPLPAPAPNPGNSRPTPQTEPPVVIQVPLPPADPTPTEGPVRRQTTPTPGPTPTSTSVPKKTKASVAGIDVTGLPDAAAIAKLRAKLEPKTKGELRVGVAEYQYVFRREEFGASVPYAALLKSARAKGGDVPLRFEVSSGTATKALRELDGQVRQDFEKVGVNVGGTLVRVKSALEKGPVQGTVEAVTLTVEAPKEDPKVEIVKPVPNATSKKYPYLLASFSTKYDASLRGRTTNLRMAARHISGTIVQDGDVFSTNRAIGPRDASNGWKEAKMFVSGQVVSGTGAGICQAASTLYNAALLADLPVVERHPHSMRVMYVPPSRDAALMWGSKDFKFRNNTGGAVMVETSVSGGKFHAKIWGQTSGSGADIRLETNVLSRSGGSTRSEAYKIVDGKKIKLSRDFYKPHP